MNNQEFEDKMTFIMERHARFAAHLEMREVREAEFEQRHKVWKVEIEDLLTRLPRVTNEGFKDTNAKINALIDSQIRLEDEQRKTGEHIRETGEQLRQTGEL